MYPHALNSYLDHPSTFQYCLQCLEQLYLLLICGIFIISSKEETEKYRTELANVRAELEPWEKQQIECKGKLDVASSESKLLKEKVRFRIIYDDSLVWKGNEYNGFVYEVV